MDGAGGESVKFDAERKTAGAEPACSAVVETSKWGPEVLYATSRHECDSTGVAVSMIYSRRPALNGPATIEAGRQSRPYSCLGQVGPQDNMHTTMHGRCLIVELEGTGVAAVAESGVVDRSYTTKLGAMYVSLIESFLDSDAGQELRGSVQLIFTSPPFPLNRKKKYGNKTGEEYLAWLHDLAPRLTEMLTPDGSIVMELGNAWEPGAPVMSTLALEAFLDFKKAGRLNLCQQFICHNPARLPSPAQWVTIERIRVKDSFTHVWWMSPTERPKADNRNVLIEYSPNMKELLTRRSYNGGRRPSGHVIGRESFFKDNGGCYPS